MSTSEAAYLMREIAQPRPVKVVLARLGEKLGWTANRVRDVWHADTRVRLDDNEMEQLRALARVTREAALADKFAQLTAEIETLQEALRQERAKSSG